VIARFFFLIKIIAFNNEEKNKCKSLIYNVEDLTKKTMLVWCVLNLLKYSISIRFYWKIKAEMITKGMMYNWKAQHTYEKDN